MLHPGQPFCLKLWTEPKQPPVAILKKNLQHLTLIYFALDKNLKQLTEKILIWYVLQQ